MTEQDKSEFRSYCQSVTETQLRNVHAMESRAKRIAYAQIAKEVMVEKGLL